MAQKPYPSSFDPEADLGTDYALIASASALPWSPDLPPADLISVEIAVRNASALGVSMRRRGIRFRSRAEFSDLSFAIRRAGVGRSKTRQAQCVAPGQDSHIALCESGIRRVRPFAASGRGALSPPRIRQSQEHSRTMALTDSNVLKLAPDPGTPAYRSAPHNIEAEQSLLGAILVNNDAFYRVSDFLEPKHSSNRSIRPSTRPPAA